MSSFPAPEAPETTTVDPVTWLRGAAPYINDLRGQAVVVCIAPGDAVQARLEVVARDISLLHSLGVGIVVCYGFAAQSWEQPAAAPVSEAALAATMASAAQAQATLEAVFSGGRADTPARQQRLRVVGGNLVMARPVGVRDGVDHGRAGLVRRVDGEAIRGLLRTDAIVQLPPLAVSGVGEVFLLDPADIAIEVAVQLGATKLVVMSPYAPLGDDDGTRISNLDLGGAEQLLGSLAAVPARRAEARLLQTALDACRRGVQRTHLLDWGTENALVNELYTPDGIGTMVNADSYDRLRPATLEDIGALLALLEPLHLSGTLLERTRESLETDIERFRVLERDGLLVGCAAAYPFPEDKAMELACLAVRPGYANGGRGEALLRAVEREARRAGVSRLFVFTTQASHWFRERGFVPAPVETAPAARRSRIAPGRNSVMLSKAIG